MKKNDWILAGSILVAAVLFIIVNFYLIHSEGAKVNVTVDGELFVTYLLEEDQQIDINGTNMLVISNGKADMTEADCPDKLCVHQKAISREKETIVCLPNKIVAEVIGAPESELDAIAN